MTATEIETKSESEEFKAINFNTRSIQRGFEAFSKEGLDVPSSISTPKSFLDKFKSKLRPDKAPLQIIINTMNRRQITTYDSKTGKAVKKDVLTYNVDMHGVDWLGNDMWIRQHIEGKSIKPKFRTIMEMNYETGEHIPKKEYDGTEEEYYIELPETEKGRRQIIEDIINRCNGTLLEKVLWYYHAASTATTSGYRTAIYTQEQFINSSLQELGVIFQKTSPPPDYPNKDNKKPYMG